MIIMNQLMNKSMCYYSDFHLSFWAYSHYIPEIHLLFALFDIQ